MSKLQITSQKAIADMALSEKNSMGCAKWWDVILWSIQEVYRIRIAQSVCVFVCYPQVSRSDV